MFFTGFEKRAALKGDALLQPHQERVRERIRQGQSLLLYHGLGSGKSLSSIAATEEPGKKVDVVVPASLRVNYRKELDKFTEGKGPDRNIQSYEMAAKKGLPGGDFLVADEIQRINNAQAARAKAIVGAAPSYNQRIVLSGTPIKNAPSELAPVIKTINPESNIPLDPQEFNKRFLQEKEVSPGLWNRVVHGARPGIEVSPKNLPELRRAIHGHIDYHMPEKKGYPSTSEQIVKVPMSEEQQKIYATVTDRANPFVAWKVKHNMPLSKQESKDLNAFMTAARVVSNTTKPYGGTERSPKFERAAMDMDKHLKANPRGKALVYSNYLEGGVNEYSKHLTERGISHHIFSGELSDKERKKIVDDYNSDNVKALLISGAGSEGLDLKGTRLVQVLEPHWNKQRIDQAVGRAVRFKSHEHLPEDERNVHIMHYHSTHAPTFIGKIFHTKPATSADEFLYNLSQKKEKINQSFLDVLKSEGERASKKWEQENVKQDGIAPQTPSGAPMKKVAEIISPVADAKAQQMVEKVISPIGGTNGVEKKPPNFFDKGFKGQNKRLINKAIRHNSKGREFHVMLTYRKEDGTESTRKVTPYTTRKDVFIGKDHSREGQLRSFKLERILKMEKTAFEVGFEKQAISFFGKPKAPAEAPMTTSVVPHPGNYAGGGTKAMAESSGPYDAIKAQRNARRAAEAAGAGAKVETAAAGAVSGAAKSGPSAVQRGSSILKGFASKMPMGKVLGGAALLGGGALLGKAMSGNSQPQGY